MLKITKITEDENGLTINFTNQSNYRIHRFHYKEAYPSGISFWLMHLMTKPWITLDAIRQIGTILQKLDDKSDVDWFKSYLAAAIIYFDKDQKYQPLFMRFVFEPDFDQRQLAAEIPIDGLIDYVGETFMQYELNR